MTHTLIVCATLLLALVIAAAFKERKDNRDRLSDDEDRKRHHERQLSDRCSDIREAREKREFWADRDLDALKTRVASAEQAAIKAKEDAETVLSRMTQWERDNAFRGR